MKAIIKQVSGLSFIGKADSSHWVPLDSSAEFGGSNAATRPMELVLLGLGGCTGMDVISILQKKHAPITAFELELAAEQSPDYPKVFTKIKLNYIFYGDKTNIKSRDIEKAIELSKTTYCPVSNMLRHSVTIEYGYEIRQA